MNINFSFPKLFETLTNNLVTINKAIGETLVMMFVSTIVSIVLGFILGTIMFYTHKNGPKPSVFIYTIISAIVNLFRSIPFLIFIIIVMPLTTIIVGQSYGVAASIIPLSIVGSAIYARSVEQNFLNLPTHLEETAFALGANKIQSFFYFYLKEATSSLILGLTSTVVSLVSYSTVMGVIGGGGVGDMALKFALVDYNYYMMLISLIIVITFVQVIQVGGNLAGKFFDKKQYKKNRR